MRYRPYLSQLSNNLFGIFNLAAHPKPKYVFRRGSWLLTPGSWLLVPGSWLLAPGSWLLAAGCWLLMYFLALVETRICYLTPPAPVVSANLCTSNGYKFGPSQL